ncbi:MAG TPA: hypothetical protein PKA33_05390 [Amaricoccus sp.]|uniref:hypothetical protein n=1 Tax=Amaricoccus sp. TaxID=1872485 RepID=UPI002C0156C8|nr:hypothetical protein [Amaricoccus sp.]HMQ93992.1 hypothetical protein [Amaricoccus sp.]HMR51990.1 hypothetical protein [Amaricoccus sp.]HMR60344.1 hypothetical protein [Amaricoccus sp.]HMT98792.1 hypothetical protein [Amaricoccus sp.]
MFDWLILLWRRHRGLVLALVAACLVTLFFAIRLTISTLYWAGHRDATLAGWMTVGYVAHSYDVDRLRLAEALGLDPDQRPRLTLDEIAARNGMPLAEVEVTLLAVIAEERAGRTEQPVVPDRP